ncbi:MAG: S1C family serine protease [Thermodesulfobacteriota bacterium]
MSPRGFVSVFILAALSFALFANPVFARNDSVKKSVVQIQVQKTIPSYKQPWILNESSSVFGSGCVISGNHILTSAHVVSHAAFIHVSKFGDPNKYTAELLFISHEADLALLTVRKKKFFKGIKPIHISRKLVQTQKEVEVYGFPIGGETMSVTRGIVSRVEHEIYSHSVYHLLMSQLDAPINPGNSGGPVIVDGELVGVVIQALVSSENIGYMAPTPVIDHFLDDVREGSYDGFPVLGILAQKAQNPDLRAKKLIREDSIGVLVKKVAPGSPAAGKIAKGDVILSISGTEIFSDGTVNFRGSERTNFSHLIDSRQIGDEVKVTILRDGIAMDVDIALTKGAGDLRLVNANYDRPSYFIFAGCVFSPLTFNYLRSWGDRWYISAPSSLLSKLAQNIKSFPGEEVVLLTSVLPSEINYGYHGLTNRIIEKVNGIKIENMRHLVKVVESEAATVEFITFEDSDGEQIVFSSQKALKSGAPLLATYQIAKDRSPDLVVPVYDSMGL